MEFFKKIGIHIADFLNAQSMQKKIAMAITAVVITIGVSMLFFWASSKTYSPLMTNLTPEDSANIIKILRERNIPFRADAGGKNIHVSPENLDQLRMELATMGLPQTSIVGYEVFDKNSLGQTSFVQKVNQKRALEGELMRTINSIHGVRRSRVHLAIPQKSAFVEDQKKPTASVVIDLDPGAALTERQVYGIGNLISRAVEGLDMSDVVVVDSLGKMLSKNNNDSLSQMTASQLEFKGKIERDLESRIRDMLSRVVGDGHVVASVSADLDFSSSVETQTSYDADGSALRSVQKNTQSMEGNRPAPAGVPGAQSNLPLGNQNPAIVKTTDTKTSNEVANYAIPETVRKTTKSPGGIKRLNVAVVVDGKISKTKNKDGVVESKVEAWTPEKIKEFESIVAAAVGIDRKRGDTIDIKNMEFRQTDFSEAEALLAERERKAYVQNLMVYAAMAMIIVLFFFMVVRPFIRWVTDNTSDGMETFLPQTLEELEKIQNNSALPGLEDVLMGTGSADQVDPEKIESEMVKEKIITLVDSNPHKAALILRDWLAGVNDVKEDKPGEEKSANKGKSA